MIERARGRRIENAVNFKVAASNKKKKELESGRKKLCGLERRRCYQYVHMEIGAETSQLENKEALPSNR